ncbi:MAG: glycoside hydrolase family 3 C-terminal domain-containing protein [Sphingomonadales bacterium]|nr:glycoside hydrolase family 3 C-terminal domain-containing protein [Sphingomonadales bacterium]
MDSLRISRRSALLGATMVAAWSTSPLRAAIAATASRATPAFVDALIGQMTLKEKAGQLNLMPSSWGPGPTINPIVDTGGVDKQIEDAVAGKITGVFNGNGAEFHHRLQDAVTRRSRLKIPLLFGADVIHGYRTVFPVPLAEAGSFEPSLAERTSRIAATEAAAAGIDWTFAPMVDVARDARWGRGVEGSGEDPWLGTLFAGARVRGFQGKDLTAADAVLSCIKHFAAYGAAEAGLDYSTVDISPQTLHDVLLPPYEAGFAAGAGSGMASFNEINGIPSTGNHWLLNKLLRDEWKFPGFIVSDYTGDQEMIVHGYAKDDRDAARLAILAGCDMGMASNLYYTYLPGLVRDGLVPEAVLDQSVRRVLSAKAALGLFDNPLRRIDTKREAASMRRPASLALAREAASKSVVLLKNEGGLLPLPRAGKRIALIGPHAGQNDLIGPWAPFGDDAKCVSFETGIRTAMGDPKALSVVRGCEIDKPIAGGIDAAVAAARAADVVLLAVGEGQFMSGESQSRSSVTLPQVQRDLAEAVAATGTPVVVLLRNGRALALHGAVRDARAIMVTWFLGSEAGNGLADVLFGKVSPSARLPVSFPYESGQEPYYYYHKNSGRAQPPGPRQDYKTQFREAPNAALYPFGHGLTYSTVEYAGLELPATMPWNGAIEIAARLTNTGAVAIDEVAQLYVHDQVASMTRPVRLLKGFAKVHLAPGESKRVTFRLAFTDLLFSNADGKLTVEPGAFTVWVAPSAQAGGVTGAFSLVTG